MWTSKPEWVKFSAKDHNPLTVDEEGLLIPGNLQQSADALGKGSRYAYTLLQQVTFGRVGMFGEGQSTDIMRDGSPESLGRQQGRSTDGGKLHGVYHLLQSSRVSERIGSKSIELGGGLGFI